MPINDRDLDEIEALLGLAPRPSPIPQAAE